MPACKPNQAIYKMLWCPNPPPMYVYLDWPYIMAFRMRTQERLRAMSLSLFTIAILTWGIKTCLLNQKLILQISVFGRRNPHYKWCISAAELLSFPGCSPLTGLLLICSWPTLTIALQSLADTCSTMVDFVQAVFEEISLERNPALWQSEKDSRYLFRSHMSHKKFTKLYCGCIPSFADNFHHTSVKKSQNGDTLGPVELIVWLEQGNQGDWCEQDDQGEVFIIIFGMSTVSAV